MPNILLNNLPLHPRPIDESLRNFGRERAVQHSFKPNSAPIESAFGPERRQDGSFDGPLCVRDGRLGQLFLLGEVGVVE
jgi:hypothetical protein